MGPLGRCLLAAGLLLGLALPAAPSLAKGRRLVVVDPGHGGRKSGTRTAQGVTEAHIVLQIAREVRDRLKQAGFEVVLTRDSDREVDLDQRVSLANAEKAAVFLSIHCNYAPVPERRGAETYILSAQASDEISEQLAELENEGGNGGGRREEETVGDLDFILKDLQRTTAHKDSALLAHKVQSALAEVATVLPSRGLRQAPFKVLRGAEMPAALVEVGYLSNERDAAFLSGARGQRSAGHAVALGVMAFFRELEAQER